MAKDDYHVIAFRILAYLYSVLKRGVSVDTEMLKSDSEYLNINETYWAYILEHLLKDGYIEGLSMCKAWGGVAIINLESIQITPKGIEYLQNNSAIQQAKEFLKEIKAMVPFI